MDILMPVTRKGRLSIASIKSVLRQKANNWKLTVLVARNDPEIYSICKEFSSPKVAVHFAGKDLGSGEAKRWLIDRTSAKYFFLIDDDDLLVADSVKAFSRYCARHPEAVLVRGRFRAINAQGRYIAIPAHNYIFQPRTFYKGATVDPINFGQPYIIKRSAYEKTSGWRGIDLKGKGEVIKAIGGDINIFLQLEEIGPIHLLDKILYLKRVHQQNQLIKINMSERKRVLMTAVDNMIKRRRLKLSAREQIEIKRQICARLESHAEYMRGPGRNG
ncbi:MAG: glycosyltransferase family 2 protein [Candidatus Saganbacteria bacterium]|nr:glycosyltransferase family 2 protein [Candidatus Saganbacteria bacterium]